MPNVTGLSHVVLQCRDLDRMVSFYREVLGLVVTHEREGRMVFMTANPEVEDHQIALAAGRRGEDSPLAHIAWHVTSAEEVKAAYDHFKATGIPIDHTVSHAYATLGNTVSCYFRDPEGNLLEVFAMVDEADPEHRENRGLDFEGSVDEIVAQARGLSPATVGH